MALDLGPIQSAGRDLGPLQSAATVGPQTAALPGIADSSAIGALGLGDLSISLPGIGDTSAIGSIRLTFGTVIELPGIADTSAIGSFKLAKSGGFHLASIVDPEKVGVLGLRGGQISTKIFIGGVDRSKYLTVGSATVTQQTRGRWSATFVFNVNDGTWGPAAGQTVLIQDFGRRSFAGCIKDVDITRVMKSTNKRFFACTATDKTAILDQRYVKERTWPAGTDLADVMREVVAEVLIKEGITAGALPVTFDTIDTDLVINYETCRSVFDKASTLAGGNWWLDTFAQLQISAIDDAPPCPFEISETSRNFRNQHVKFSLVDYRDVQYVRSNLTASPDDGSVGFTFSYTVNQPEAAARGFAQGAAVLPTPASSIISIKVNGVAVPKIYNGATDPETYDLTNPLYGHVWWAFFPSPYVNPPGSASNVPNPAEKPALGATIEIVYIPTTQSTLVVAAVSPFAPSPLPGLTGAGESYGTCGSGIIEAVEQVNDITSIEDLQAIGEAILVRSGGTLAPVFLTVETDVPGAEVGQKLHVDLPLDYLPDRDLLITSVTATSLGVNILRNRPDLTPDGIGNSFRYQLQASSADLALNAISFFERLIRRTEHPNPVVRQEIITFIIAPGASVVSGTVDSNPKRATKTSKLFEAYAIAGIPPVDQDLYLDILDMDLGGISIFSQSIKIGAGIDTLVSLFTFYQNPGWLFRNHVLKARATYVITGPNPTPAGSVSLDVVGYW